MIVSVVSPCRNEVGHIDTYVESVLSQECHGFDLEVLIADGSSSDGTLEKLQAWARRDSRLRTISNPGLIVSTGLNRAVGEASGEFIVRMDIHTTYATDYVAECVKALQQTAAVCVGGPWRAKAEGLLQGAIAAAFRSRFGSGGAASRRSDHEGPVDTVYLGAWRREVLLRLGGFDETFVRNQDDELNLRIHRDGGIVWQSPTIRSWYTPRASFEALFRQFYQYGYWKVAVIRKHRMPASPRHLAPLAFVITLFALALGGWWWPPAWSALAVLTVVYVVAALADAARDQQAPRSLRGRAGFVFACLCMHVGYGTGFVRGLIDFALRRRGAPESMARLTR